ncbi:MAG: spore coat protein [Clostridiales bacterium]|jgi:spore coat protein CotF|nr:spore coat protein [Clostridiales bacterium]
MNVVMQEKDILQDILVLEKDIVKSYGSFLIESSCPKMRTLLNDNFKQSAGDQFCVFDAMSKRGYYPTKDATDSDVQEAKSKYCGIQKNMKPIMGN